MFFNGKKNGENLLAQRIKGLCVCACTQVNAHIRVCVFVSLEAARR